MAVCEAPPAAPVTTILNEPVFADLLTASVILEVPLPLIDFGLKLTVVPLPCPVAESEMEEMLPDVTVVVMVEEPEEPLETLREVGLAAMVKAEAVVPVTVRAMVAVSTVPSAPVPVTVMVEVPAVAVAEAVKDSTEAPVAAIGFVAKLAATPGGSPETDSVIDEL